MRKYLLLLLALITLACNRRGDEPTAEKAYAMLERVAEQNALGNKPAALALADSALALNPADTTRCWLMSEKAVTLVDMGRMADAVGVAQGAYALARKLTGKGISTLGHAHGIGHAPHVDKRHGLLAHEPAACGVGGVQGQGAVGKGQRRRFVAKSVLFCHAFKHGIGFLGCGLVASPVACECD